MLRCVCFLVISFVGAQEMTGMSRIFKPPLGSTSVEFIPKFQVVTDDGPVSVSTGIAFPLELALKAVEPEPENLPYSPFFFNKGRDGRKGFTASLERMGVPAKRCLLRAICEVEKYPQDANESLLGEMVSLVLRVPMNDSPKMELYNEAGKAGRTGDCSAYYDCFVSVFKMISETPAKTK
ncbi:uncharacterized protein LOC114828243 [Galendromus occidentalis]|uniref:Uncharacterized protein LOC114828243 n=1 Tax=Galendromus occidentalis TaxID=34638 RepID=A0AAJ7SGJ7_9ACAR|nr:uncharacterized protein LOC114828243 [Galendromus occidentalis]